MDVVKKFEIARLDLQGGPGVFGLDVMFVEWSQEQF